jgi:polar amino acid transport system substrate-binding protein
VLDDKNVMLNAIAERGLQDRVTLVDGFNSTAIYIAFSPRSGQPEKLAHILDDGMQRLRASGRLASIFARYHVEEPH